MISTLDILLSYSNLKVYIFLLMCLMYKGFYPMIYALYSKAPYSSVSIRLVLIISVDTDINI